MVLQQPLENNQNMLGLFLPGLVRVDENIIQINKEKLEHITEKGKTATILLRKAKYSLRLLGVSNAVFHLT